MKCQLQCIECHATYDPDEIIYLCPSCGGLLEVVYDLPSIDIDFHTSGECRSVWKYRSLLPVERDPVTICEGGTPLYRIGRLAKDMGAREMFVKHEGLNPTGSFKDRGMTVGVTRALELGMKTVACASTGNTSASLSIYAAKAEIPAVVLLPGGKVALGKVAQALIHGAKVLNVRGNFDQALQLVREVCDEYGFYLLNSINPFRLEGQKTIAFEIADELGWEVPDRVILPVGNAGNISAIYKGFKELRECGITDTVPKMTGIQAEGARPVVDAIDRGLDKIAPEPNPETIATAIRIGDPVNAAKALRAIRESGGLAISVTDDEIIQAQRDLASLEGIGVEPASATSVAGMRKLLADGTIDSDERIVCITTGHLLKDPTEVVEVCAKPIEVDATIEAVRKAVFG
uniref:Threonine synthase n=1 Tax=Candidatus Methanogaster sp. ANME-2c ERB4 TaxID=2759911 RepID=A0A7G9YKV9_9EURY|nr:threonine synthase [Methanosarcinales archaeon ANME-2c ERB4]QNO50141.1 threonine synthase [Methanosarcinales archaeon ANME-2c ERB4]